LRAHAAGVYRAEAAVDLLIEHRRWLQRADFVDRFVVIVGDDAADDADTPMAFVDWPGAMAALDNGSLPGSSGEMQVLRIAASIIGAVAVDLGEVLCGLDRANLIAVTGAVMHAGGYPALTTMQPGA
jgi:hypothetical protein